MPGKYASADPDGSARDGSLVEAAVGVSAIGSLYLSCSPRASYDVADGAGYTAYEPARAGGGVSVAT